MRTGIFTEPDSGKMKQDCGLRIQGNLTSVDAGLLYIAGRRFAQLYRAIMGQEAVTISQADTIAYVLRGRQASRLYLKQKRKGQQVGS